MYVFAYVHLEKLMHYRTENAFFFFLKMHIILIFCSIHLDTCMYTSLLAKVFSKHKASVVVYKRSSVD